MPHPRLMLQYYDDGVWLPGLRARSVWFETRCLHWLLPAFELLGLEFL